MGQAPTLCRVSPSPTSMYYYFLVDSQSYPQKTMRFLLINRAFGALGRLVSEPLMQWGRRLCWIHWMVWLVGWLVGWWPEFTSFVEYVGGWNPKLRLDFTFLWNPLNRSRQKIPCAPEIHRLKSIFWKDPDLGTVEPKWHWVGTEFTLNVEFGNLPTEWSSDFISTVRTWNLKKNRKSPFALILYL